MKFLCLDIPAPGATLEKYQPHMQDEARHAWQLYKGGVVRNIYFRQDRPGVAIIAECESADAALNALRDCPLAKAGLLVLDVIPMGDFLNWVWLFEPGNA